jgi:hypothetical protein
MLRKVILRLIVATAVLGLLFQLVPLPGRGNNPPVVVEPKWDSPQTRALVKRTCLDCHSNETVWPWYSYVAPASWLVNHDVMEGRSHLNFSEWSTESRDVNEIIGVIEEGEMPPAIYLLLHPSARLTDDEEQQLITGLKNSLP